MTEQEYITYKNQCVKELTEQQETLNKLHNISSFKSWYYDQATELLTLSTNEIQINFKFVKVGSFSNNTNTWNWSWANDDTLEQVKRDTLIVKSFGEKNQVEELSKGLIESCEINCWELTAITANLLKAIGAYRVEVDHLLIFMVLISIVDNEEADRIKERFVSCGEHGSRRRAFICQHLNKTTKTGFVEPIDYKQDMILDDDDDFQAWCSLCETERLKEGEWNDKSEEFAKLRLVCEDCYFEIKRLNLNQE